MSLEFFDQDHYCGGLVIHQISLRCTNSSCDIPSLQYPFSPRWECKILFTVTAIQRIFAREGPFPAPSRFQGPSSILSTQVAETSKDLEGIRKSCKKWAASAQLEALLVASRSVWFVERDDRSNNGSLDPSMYSPVYFFAQILPSPSRLSAFFYLAGVNVDLTEFRDNCFLCRPYTHTPTSQNQN